MDELWRGSLVCLVIYGNYLLFSAYIKSIFWALCYSVLCRKVCKKCPLLFRPVFLLFSSFPVLSVVLLPSLLLLLSGNELVEFSLSLKSALESSSSLFLQVKNFVLVSLVHLLDFLNIHKDDALSDSFVYYKIYTKLEEMKDEILSGGKEAIALVSHFVFFIGFTGYFYKLPKNPLFYILAPIPRHQEILKAFEGLIFRMAMGSSYGFICGFLLSFYFSSPLIVFNGMLSGFLTVFPVLPLCLYAIPSAALFFLKRENLKGGLFVLGALTQQIFGKKIFKVEAGGNEYLGGVSVLLGFKVFGYCGVILGPLLLSSLLILWPSDREVPTKVSELLQSGRVNEKKTEQRRRPLTRTQEIMRKGK